jgi:hypothetical protein
MASVEVLEEARYVLALVLLHVCVIGEAETKVVVWVTAKVFSYETQSTVECACVSTRSVVLVNVIVSASPKKVVSLVAVAMAVSGDADTVA